jgi:hypothetical protein
VLWTGIGGFVQVLRSKREEEGMVEEERNRSRGGEMDRVGVSGGGDMG